MKMKGKFLSLTHLDGSPCIVRADRIKELKDLPKNTGTVIEYPNNQRFEVRESRLTIRGMMNNADNE